jgi:hypothetical protein
MHRFFTYYQQIRERGYPYFWEQPGPKQIMHNFLQIASHFVGGVLQQGRGMSWERSGFYLTIAYDVVEGNIKDYVRRNCPGDDTVLVRIRDIFTNPTTSPYFVRITDPLPLVEIWNIFTDSRASPYLVRVTDPLPIAGIYYQTNGINSSDPLISAGMALAPHEKSGLDWQQNNFMEVVYQNELLPADNSFARIRWFET